MKPFIHRHRANSTILAYQYNARDAKMPDGVRARTTSHGPQAMFQRPDGVVLYASQADWFVQINDEPMIVLDNPSFTALFVPAE